MASDKEAILDSKSNSMYQAPSLTSLNGLGGKLGQSGAGASVDLPAANQPPNYYQNQVLQKGKLILPTALWILLIVAGLCFLSLLVTLNKTVRTLDVLVQLEQEKGEKQRTPTAASLLARDHIEGEAPARLKWEKAPEEADVFPPLKRREQEEEEGPEEVETISGWFPHPIWPASGPHRQSPLEPEPVGLSSIMSNFFGPPPNSPAPIAGGLIMVESEPEARADNNPIESILSQLLPMGERPQKKDSFITANIDKLNINLNSGEQPEPELRKPQEAQETVQGLEQSVLERLVNELDGHRNLLAPSLPPQRHQRRPQLHREHLFHIDSAEPATIDASPFSPISSLMMPLRPPPVHGHQQPQQPASEESTPAMFGKPTSEGIIIIGNAGPASPDMLPVAPELVGKTHMKLGEPLNSPYEMLPMDIPMMFGRPEVSAFKMDRKQSPRPPHRATDEQLNAIDDNLLSSLAQGFFHAQGPAAPQPAAAFKSELPNKAQPAETLLLINNEPLSVAESEDAKPEDAKPEEAEEPPKRNQVKELFQMFFGPPPKSSLVVADGSLSDEIPKMPSLVTDPLADIKPFLKENASSVAEPEEQRLELVSSKPDGQRDKKETLDSVFNSLLSLPQFGKDEQPMRVEAQSSGAKELDLFGDIKPVLGPEYALESQSEGADELDPEVDVEDLGQALE